MDLLRWGLGISSIWALLGLTYLIAKTQAYGHRELHATAAGNPSAGIRYALGAGMSPWSKESATQHWITYLSGVMFHVALFSALARLATLSLGISLPVYSAWPMALLSGGGALCGLGLLLKRILCPRMRAISLPDDFAANALCTAFLGLSALQILKPGLESALLVSAILLFLYIPLGKIRHCFFFFTTRIALGRHFGRRGVWG